MPLKKQPPWQSNNAVVIPLYRTTGELESPTISTDCNGPDWASTHFFIHVMGGVFAIGR